MTLKRHRIGYDIKMSQNQYVKSEGIIWSVDRKYAMKVDGLNLTFVIDCHPITDTSTY